MFLFYGVTSCTLASSRGFLLASFNENVKESDVFSCSLPPTLGEVGAGDGADINEGMCVCVYVWWINDSGYSRIWPFPYQ